MSSVSGGYVTRTLSSSGGGMEEGGGGERE